MKYLENNAFVSVVIPCFNVEAWVSDAIESVLTQTHKPIELILVDNNSTDGTLEVLYDYQSRFPELIKVLVEKRRGAPSTRNCGLKHAKGDWIQFLDADDILLPEKISHQVSLIDDEEIAVISGGYQIQVNAAKVKDVTPHSNFVRALFSGSLAGVTSSILWNKKFLDRVGAWNEDWTCVQEYELMFRVFQANGRFVMDKDILTIKRNGHHSQISNRFADEKTRLSFLLRKNIMNFISKEMPDVLLINESYFFNVLYTNIRTVALEEGVEKAWGLFEAFMPKKFIPIPGQYPLRISWVNIVLFMLLGFRRTEKIYEVFRRVFKKR